MVANCNSGLLGKSSFVQVLYSYIVETRGLLRKVNNKSGESNRANEGLESFFAKSQRGQLA